MLVFQLQNLNWPTQAMRGPFVLWSRSQWTEATGTANQHIITIEPRASTVAQTPITTNTICEGHKTIKIVRHQGGENTARMSREERDVYSYTAMQLNSQNFIKLLTN